MPGGERERIEVFYFSGIHHPELPVFLEVVHDINYYVVGLFLHYYVSPGRFCQFLRHDRRMRPAQQYRYIGKLILDKVAQMYSHVGKRGNCGYAHQLRPEIHYFRRYVTSAVVVNWAVHYSDFMPFTLQNSCHVAQAKRRQESSYTFHIMRIPFGKCLWRKYQTLTERYA